MKFYDEKDKEKDNTIDENNVKETNEIEKENNNETKKEESKKVNREEEKKRKIIEMYKERDKKRKKIFIVSIISVAILITILLFSTGFALLNINNTKIMSGVTIKKVELKNLSPEEAQQKLTEYLQEILDKDILIKADNFEYTINLSQIEVKYDIDSAIQEAYKIGRNGNIFTNNYEILKSAILGKDIQPVFTYNEELLNKIVDDISVKVPDAIIDTDYYIEDNKLIIKKGTPGNSINKEKAKNAILNRIEECSNEEVIVDIIYVEPSEINIQEIHEEVYTEPKDAYYTKDPFEIFPHVEGIDFNIEEAKEALKEDKQEYEIKLKITQPEVTTNKIGTEAFPDLLSTFSTRYDSNQVDRTQNLKLASEKINGTIVMPGETFSYNKTVGERTIAKGYKEAAGYAGGRVVDTLGGGICQISSTLYDAVVYANLDIVDRSNHMFLTSYVGAGKDATVVYGAIDFKFKNTRKYPIKIKSSVKNGIAKIEIYGVKEDIEYEVEISTKILSYIPYTVKYETNNSLKAGTEKVVQNGMNGVKSITYKILKLNGRQVSSTVLSTDTYDPMNKIIQKGPQKTSSQTNDKTDNKDSEKTEDQEEKTDSVPTTTPTSTPVEPNVNPTVTPIQSPEAN